MVKALRAKVRRDLKRQRAQFGAVVATLFIGIALFVASYDAYLNLQASYQRLYSDLRLADLTISGGDADAFAAAGRRMGAGETATRTLADTPVRIDASHKLLGRVVGLPAAGQPNVGRVLVLSGSYLDAARPRGVLVEQHMADHFDLAPGDALDVLASGGWETVDVLGVVASPEYLWPAASRQEVFTTPDDFGVLFVPEALAAGAPPGSARRQALFFFGDAPDRQSLERRLKDLALSEGADAQTRAEQPSNAALQEDVKGFNELALLFPVLFLSAAAMAAYVLLTRIVYAQRAQIGTLMANGMSRRTLLGHYLSYGVVAGLAGAVPGALAGMLLARWVTSMYTSAISVPVTVIGLHPATPATGIVIGLVAGLVAAAGPALLASRLSPAEAMRGPTPTGAGRPSPIERLLPHRRPLPVRLKFVLRGIGRNRRRTAYTIVGVVLALTLILASWGMLDTTDVLLARQFEQVQRQEAQVYLTGRLTPGRLARLSDAEGVASAEPVAEYGVSLTAGGKRYETTLTAFEPVTRMHTFFVSGEETRRPPQDGVYAGVALREVLGVEVGDRVRIDIPALDSSIDRRLAGFVDEPLGTPVYMSLPDLDRAVGGSGGPAAANSAMIRFTPGADPAVMRGLITKVGDVAAYSDSKAVLTAVEQYMGLFYAFVGIMLVFGAVMAFALIFNTMSVNIAERMVEVATLRAEGVGRRAVARLIASENLLVTALGVVPGLLVGYLFSAYYLASYNSDLFRFTLHMRVSTLVISAAAILVVGLTSQWPGLRAVGRLDIPSVVRERSL